MITIILLALFAIVLGAVFWDQRKALDKVTDFEARMVDSLANIKKGLETRIDRYIETHNATVDHYDQQIDEIIERMNKITEDMVIICNEEGRIRQMPFNCHVFTDWVGPIAFVGCKGDEFCDVPLTLEDVHTMYGLEVAE